MDCGPSKRACFEDMVVDMSLWITEGVKPAMCVPVASVFIVFVFSSGQHDSAYA